jgi:hypothetical protein
MHTHMRIHVLMLVHLCVRSLFSLSKFITSLPHFSYHFICDNFPFHMISLLPFTLLAYPFFSHLLLPLFFVIFSFLSFSSHLLLPLLFFSSSLPLFFLIFSFLSFSSHLLLPLFFSHLLLLFLFFFPFICKV